MSDLGKRINRLDDCWRKKSLNTHLMWVEALVEKQNRIQESLVESVEELMKSLRRRCEEKEASPIFQHIQRVAPRSFEKIEYLMSEHLDLLVLLQESQRALSRIDLQILHRAIHRVRRCETLENQILHDAYQENLDDSHSQK